MTNINYETWPVSAKRAMREAHRRWTRFGARYNNDITRACVGLGYPSDYRAAVDLGLMQPTRPERTQVMGWYTFTDEGVRVYREWQEAVNAVGDTRKESA